MKMRPSVFCLLLVLVVVPPWFALNCSFLRPPPDPRYESVSESGLATQQPLKVKTIRPTTQKTAYTGLNRYKSTSSYVWVRDVDIVVTTSHYLWHRDLPNKEIKAGGGTVDMPVRIDRSGVAKGMVLSKTPAQLQCTSYVNETAVFIYIFHSENLGNLHEGLFALFSTLKEIDLLDKPIRMMFMEQWGPNNLEYINAVFPNAVQPPAMLTKIVENHPVDTKSTTPPLIIDGLCVREVVLIRDQFPIFPPPSRRMLGQYRRFLLNRFGISSPIEHASRAPHYAVPEAALADQASVAATGGTGKPRVVIIKRNRDKKILEEDALLEALRSRLTDAEILYVAVDKLQPTEVAKLMQGTTVLVGTHGSGLANLWFLPRTSAMIVIHPPGVTDLLSDKSFQSGAPWLIDYRTLAEKLKLNTYVHTVETEAEGEEIKDCGSGRWGLYCAYLKNVKVEPDALSAVIRQAIDDSLARKDEQFRSAATSSS